MPDADSFAEMLFQRSHDAALVDAATGQRHPLASIPGIAAKFLSAGLSPGEVVILATDVSAESVMAYLAALYAGLVPLPVHVSDLSRFAPEALTQLPKVVACWARGPAPLRSFPTRLRHIVGLDSTAPGAIAPRIGEQTAVLMPTSGSTGAPDVIAVSSDNLLCNTRAIVRSQGLGPDDRAMLVLPTSYCFGASVVHSHLWAGGDVVVDRRFVFPDRVVEAMATFGCTSFAGVPTAYRTLAQHSCLGTNPVPSLRRFLQAGGALDRDTVMQIRRKVPHAAFFVMYGQTEATSRITTLQPEDLDRKPGSVGLPVDGVSIDILTDEGRAAGPGEIGEVVVRGASVARPLLPGSPKFRNGALYTGDLGHVDADGYLYIDGRKSHFLKCRGVRIGYWDIEHLVQQVPGVAAALAFPIADPDCGEAIGLAIVPMDGTEPQALKTSIAHALPRQWTLGRLDLLSELPLTPSGKPDRARLASVCAIGA